jgi:hypothetical protein
VRNTRCVGDRVVVERDEDMMNTWVKRFVDTVVALGSDVVGYRS